MAANWLRRDFFGCDILELMSRGSVFQEPSESAMRKRRMLLLSNSRNQGQGYLEHAQDQIRAVLGDRIHSALFIPFASVVASYDEFAANIRDGFSKLPYELHSLHEAADPKSAIAEAEALVVGGGNTFQLLNILYEKDLLASIQKCAGAGVPYIGWSAGANIACPTIRTTNDMPIVEPPSFNALNLVPFQINPHFIDFRPAGDPSETKAERLTEFIALNPGVYVAGMRDGTMLRVEGHSIKLDGTGRVCIFMKDQDPTDYGRDDSLQFLLGDGEADLTLPDGTPFASVYAEPNPRRPRRFA